MYLVETSLSITSAGSRKLSDWTRSTYRYLQQASTLLMALAVSHLRTVARNWTRSNCADTLTKTLELNA